MTMPLDSHRAAPSTTEPTGRSAGDELAGGAGCTPVPEVDPAAASASRSVERALAMLELIARRGRPLGLAEIATELAIPKSSALRLLRGLVRREFAHLGPDGRYAIGARAFGVGAAYLLAMTPVIAIESELEALGADLGVAAHFAVADGADAVYLAGYDPSRPGLSLAVPIGARQPLLFTAVGRAQLAYRARSSLEARAVEPGPTSSAPSPTDASTAAADELLMELTKVRARGYAIDEGGSAAGIRSVAAPVFDSGGCCGAVGASCLQHAGPSRDEMVAGVLGRVDSGL
jgi:DNA-binding IclR family transcriptional regulator